tara:strand:- start:188 stop:1819 length:1632 start_codon:yes stop_codon:yes gene_type:complete
MNILFISDFFLRDGVTGGAELVDDELTTLLSKENDIDMINSYLVDIKLLESEKYDSILVSNFVNLSEQCKEFLSSNKNYFIMEHDHKYLKSRNPATYHNYEAPTDEVVNVEFYKNAKAVFCQTKMHTELLRKNIMLDNIVNLAGSLWSEEEFEVIEKYSNTEKVNENLVISSENPIKNTKFAIQYCERYDMPYSLVPAAEFETFISNLSTGKTVVFFPLTCESCCRVLVEARMLGCSVLTSNLAGATSEEWFKLSGTELINEMRENKKRILKKITDAMNLSKEHFVEFDIPKVSIITSVYNGDKFIRQFMEDMTSQTMFHNSELILIDCNSPGNEKSVIDEYLEKHDNIIYERLDSDPGIYGAWNRAIEISTGELLTNANLDDRRSKNQIEELTRSLVNNPDIDLVYSSNYITTRQNETYENNSSSGRTYDTYEFSKSNMVKCLPGAMPVWRKSMHDKAGSFDESLKSAGDWEMWLRAVDSGSKFKKVPGVHGLYFMNPEGMSTTNDKEKAIARFSEEKDVFWKYSHIFGKENVEKYRRHFSQ